MNFLNAEIKRLTKDRKKSLVRKQISCGIFQELDADDLSTNLNDFEKPR